MFTGSTVVLTGVGAEGQVGEVVARAFADQGASLVLVDRQLEKASARADALVGAGHQARGYACDLSDEKAVGDLAMTVRREHGGRVHALVHMAGGFAMSGRVAESSLEVWNRQITINLTTAYLASRAFIPLLRGGGAIVFFASQAALPGSTGAEMAAYTAAKSGVAVLARAIAAEERAAGVRANALAPSSIRTVANIKSMGEGVRYVEREEVAAAVVFLCSELASAITGQMIALA
jgi:NAD(P)-dependent dehydrogenase (short-subunit alcohol dehydrogenase family)